MDDELWIVFLGIAEGVALEPPVVRPEDPTACSSLGLIEGSDTSGVNVWQQVIGRPFVLVSMDLAK